MSVLNNSRRRGLLFLKKHFMIIAICLSIFVGFLMGVLIKNSSYLMDNQHDSWFRLPGVLFIRSLKLLVLPVVFVGVVTATSSLTSKENLGLTLICIGLTHLTHFLSLMCALLGSFILNVISAQMKQKLSPIKSFRNSSNSLLQTGSVESAVVPVLPERTTYDIISDLLRNLIPNNIIKATTSQEMTRYVMKASKNGTLYFKSEVIDQEGINLLGILVFALLIGLSASINHDKVKAFREFFQALNEVIITVLRWLIAFAPIGIASLIISAILDIEDLVGSLKQIGLFVLVCSGTLLVYGVLVLSLLVFIVMRKNPFVYYAHFFESILLGFATTSGAVCIHKSIEICEQKLKMDKRLSRFTVPMFTALQSDGSGLFIVMSCLFLVQFNSVQLSVGDYVIILITASILCLCLPPVPSSSIVTVLVVLNSINQSGLNISILYTVDWILDRIRTSVNVYSHGICAVMSAELCKSSFKTMATAEAVYEGDEGTFNENYPKSAFDNLTSMDGRNNKNDDDTFNEMDEITRTAELIDSSGAQMLPPPTQNHQHTASNHVYYYQDPSSKSNQIKLKPSTTITMTANNNSSRYLLEDFDETNQQIVYKPINNVYNTGPYYSKSHIKTTPF